MTTILYRSAPELSTGSGRTVYGLAVPYGVVADVSDPDGRTYRERFDPGAFGRSIRERGDKVRLFDSHNTRRLPIGRAVELREQADGLHVAFEVAATRDGDDTLELVRSGIVDAFSIGFRGIRDRREGDVVVRTEAALMEVSLVGMPAYAGAAVAGVRSATDSLILPRAIAQARLALMDW